MLIALYCFAGFCAAGMLFCALFLLLVRVNELEGEEKEKVLEVIDD
jgi:hypothetical protein